jgi:segregation and condensation protein A
MADGDQVTHGDGSDPPLTGAAGDPAWDDWQTPLRAPTIPVLHLDGFDGPMDLLLDLAERQRIDLGRMSVLALAEQFVAAMERLADRVMLEQRADWLVMAARLVLLRSRLLFPASSEAAAEAERDAAAELRRIDALAQMRAAAGWLQARPQLGQDVFVRPLAPRPREGGYVALMEACLVLLRGRGGRPEEPLVYRQVVPDLWRVSDALARIRLTLAEQPEGGALAKFLPYVAANVPDRELKARAAVASTLLAGLELAREGALSIEQQEDYGRVCFLGKQAAQDL